MPIEKIVEKVSGGEIREMEPKQVISSAVTDSTFFREIGKGMNTRVPRSFTEKVVSAVIGMKADEQKKVLNALGGKTGTNCALATLTAVSKLVAAGELHGVEVLGARGVEPDFSRLGSVLGQLNRRQVEAMLKAIEENPGEEIVGLADRIRTSIKEAQK